MTTLDIGLILFAGGLAFCVLSLQSEDPWHAPETGSTKIRFPFLSIILCPISASLLLVSLGLGIGYGSWIGLLISVVLLFPGLLWRMRTVLQQCHS